MMSLLRIFHDTRRRSLLLSRLDDMTLVLFAVEF